MSAQRKIVTLIEEPSSTRALIIGGNAAADYLAEKLEQYGCQVHKEGKYFPHLGTFHYIFQFGDFPSTATAVEKHLLPTGKLIFIETDTEEIGFVESSVRVLCVGDLSLWDKDELVKKIFRVAFTAHVKQIVDARKHSPRTVSNSVPVYKKHEHIAPLPSIKKPPVSYPVSYSPITNCPMVDNQWKRVKNGAPKVLIEKKSHLKAFMFFLVMLVLITGLLAGFIVWYVQSVQQMYANIKSDIISSDLSKLSSDLSIAKKKLRTVEDVYALFTRFTFFLKDTKPFQDISHTLSVADNLLIVGEEVLASQASMQGQGSISAGDSFGLSRVDFQNLRMTVQRLREELHNIKPQIDQITLPYFPKDSFVQLVSSTLTKLNMAQDLMPLFEKLLFTQTPKTYLILFQNSMELRPTGGFIGSIGLTSVQNGRIMRFAIEDVYAYDGQLKGHIDPPSPIRKYLSQPNFFLRDSNFDPDFALSAAKASWFLQKEKGMDVDGVIGVNLFVVQKLLSVLGSVKLSDFKNEEITADNFFLKAHLHSQENFFAGSTQKKDFLTAVANAVVAKIQTGAGFYKLLPILKQSLDEKNVLIFVNDENIQKEIEQRGYAGRMVEISCLKDVVTQLGKGQSCYADYLAIIDANLGVNKANYFIGKAVRVEKKIENDGKITSTATVVFENTATAEIYSGTTYTNYIRFFVPQDSKLLKVTLNNDEITDVDTEQYGQDKTVFGFLLKVAAGNTAVVSITYSLPRPFSPDASYYQLFYQKQAGDKVSPFELTVSAPESYVLKPLNFSETMRTPTRIKFVTDTSVDRIFVAEKSR